MHTAAAHLEEPAVLPAHQYLEQRAEIQGSGLALRCGDHNITYGELNSRANRIAWRLRQLGVGPETITAIFLERSIEAIVAIFGVLKAGGAYLPIDPSYPAERVKAILDDAMPCATLATIKTCANIHCSQPQTISLEQLEGLSAAESGDNPSFSCSLDGLAAVTFTSGSTGTPKGVMHTHESLVRYMPDFQADDITCLNSPLSFGASFSRIFPPIACGVPIVIVPEDTCEDPAELASLIGRENITTMALVPSLLRGLLEFEAVAPLLASLRRVTVSGASLTEDLAALFVKGLPEAALLYGYGSSETGGTTLGRITRDGIFDRRCIGFPLSHTEAYIVNEALEEVPAGEVGELCIGGTHIARGYLNLEALTATRFVRNPFKPDSGSRLFRTHDLALFRPDGRIELRGRLDHLVKIRGYRVELAEVEGVLLNHKDLADAAVVAQEQEGEARLVAYLVGREGIRPQAARLRAHTAAALPAFMVPAIWVVLDSLPLTATGKVDRSALPAPERVRPDLDSTYTPARTEREKQLTEIWAALLDLELIGIHDSFFDLGGDSVIAVQITNRLWALYQLEVPVRAVFEHPTIAELSARIEAGLSDRALANA